MKQKFDIDWVSTDFYLEFEPIFIKEFEKHFGKDKVPGNVEIVFDVKEKRIVSEHERKENRLKALRKEKELLGLK